MSTNKDHKEKAIRVLKDSLWFSAKTCIEVAEGVGFNCKVLPTHPRIWQGFYVADTGKFMFNLLLLKESYEYCRYY